MSKKQSPAFMARSDALDYEKQVGSCFPTLAAQGWGTIVHADRDFLTEVVRYCAAM
jgi:hypothetical protein